MSNALGPFACFKEDGQETHRETLQQTLGRQIFAADVWPNNNQAEGVSLTRLKSDVGLPGIKTEMSDPSPLPKENEEVHQNILREYHRDKKDTYMNKLLSNK